MPAESDAEKNAEAKTKNRPSKNSENQRVAEAIAVLNRTLAEQANANRKQEYREDTGNKLIRGLTLLFVILTTIGIFWQASIFNSQLIEAQKVFGPIRDQADASKRAVDAAMKQSDAATRQSEMAAKQADFSAKALTQAQRAWVGPRDARFESKPASGKTNKIIIEYQNTGKEPALGFTFDAEHYAATLAQDADGTITKKTAAYVNKCGQLLAMLGGGVVYPASGFSALNLSLPIDEKLIDDEVIDGKKVIVVNGCFAYVTGGAAHHSAFCYFYRGDENDSNHLSICLNGNYAD